MSTHRSHPVVSPIPPPPFQNAKFDYDGDGKRVKSIFNGTATTFFVGNYYEVTGSTVTNVNQDSGKVRYVP